ncbi:MAG TPA: glycosyltransferase [Gemmataceae bacterium]|nr:glycosyltransferase [Gemmataceae bacterium]
MANLLKNSAPGPRAASPSAKPRAAAGGLRVCHLAKFYPPAPGGIESHVRTLARAQAGLGAEVRVVCVNHLDLDGRDVTWSPLARTATVEEWDGPVRVTRLGKWGNLARLDVCPGLPLALRRLRSEADVFHLHAPNPTMTLALAAAPLPAALVVTHHSDVVRQRLLGRLFRPFESLVYRRANRLLSDSPGYPDGSPLLTRFADKVSVLPLGIDPAPYLGPSPAALEHALRLREAHGEPLWLSVGRLVYYKGLHNAVKALAAAPGRWLVIGEGPAGPELRRLAAAEGVADRVVWRGHVGEDELVGAYHAATALWFPSNARSESFGLVQVEAMAAGCPVINTGIPASGVAWVSRHGETGLTVPVDDPAALAAAARRIAGEADLRARLSAGARLRVRKLFEERVMAERSLELYREVMASGVASAPRVPTAG